LSIINLNKALKNFEYGKCNLEDGRVPSDLFDLKSYKSPSGFKMSATHTWTLSRIFPFIFGKRLQLNKYFIHYLDGIKIFFLLLADSFTEESIVVIESSITKYLTQFKKYYNTITPKLHFLVHYGRCIRTFGPLKNCWVMRFESKHSYFKRVQHSIHNTINTSKSLAQRHQYFQVLSLKAYTPILSLGPVLKIISNEFDSFFGSSEHHYVRWADYNNIRYNTGSSILNNENEFCRIEELIIHKGKLFMAIIKLFNNGYRKFMNSYEISLDENSNNKTIIEAPRLKYVWPLDIYTIDKKQFIILKYPADGIINK
jgi:hypothetical protein